MSDLISDELTRQECQNVDLWVLLIRARRFVDKVIFVKTSHVDQIASDNHTITWCVKALCCGRILVYFVARKIWFRRLIKPTRLLK